MIMDLRLTRLPGSDPVWQVHDGDRLLGTVEEGFSGFRAQPIEGKPLWHADREKAAEWLRAAR